MKDKNEPSGFIEYPEDPRVKIKIVDDAVWVDPVGKDIIYEHGVDTPQALRFNEWCASALKYYRLDQFMKGKKPLNGPITPETPFEKAIAGLFKVPPKKDQ
jgi:hypothetical protein